MSPPRPWLQLDCLTTVNPLPFSGLNASAVAGCQDAVTIFRAVWRICIMLIVSCMPSSPKESISP